MGFQEKIAELEKEGNIQSLEDIESLGRGGPAGRFAAEAIKRLKDANENLKESDKAFTITNAQAELLKGQEGFPEVKLGEISNKITEKDQEIKVAEGEVQNDKKQFDMQIEEVASKNKQVEVIPMEGIPGKKLDMGIEEVENQNQIPEVEMRDLESLKENNLQIEIYEKNIENLQKELVVLEKWKDYFSKNPIGQEFVQKSPTHGVTDFIERTKNLKSVLSEYIPLMHKYRDMQKEKGIDVSHRESNADTKYQDLIKKIYENRVQFSEQQDPTIEINWNSTSEGRIAYADVYIGNLPVIGTTEPMPLSRLIELSIEDKNKMIEINKKRLDEASK